MEFQRTPVAKAATRPLNAAARSRHLAWSWLPLLALLAWVMAMGLGVGGPGRALAATTNVTGTVDKAVTMDVSGCTAAASLSFIGGLVPDQAWTWTTQDCTVSYGSNNSPAGASLQVGEDLGAPGGGAGPALKCVGGGCAGDSINDVAAGTTPGAAGSNFGAILWGTSGAASAVWSQGNVSHAGYPVADVPTTACQTTSIGVGGCDFRFGAEAKIGSDSPGAYQAQVQLTTMAN